MADDRAKLLSEFVEPLRVEPGSKVRLAKDFDPGYKASFLKKKDGATILQAGVEVLAEYQDRLAAQDSWGVLVCLQALDAGGKDGTIRHVMSGVNPQGVRVSGFKVQRIRFLRRVDLPEKNWKFSAADARERKYWDDYQAAFSGMLSNTSTGWAPWYVIPADHKWFARICVSAVLALTLMDIDPRYPQVDQAKKQDLAETRRLPEAEAPQGAAADPAKAELAAKAKKEQAARESKQASKQRKQMKKVREDLREARHGR